MMKWLLRNLITMVVLLAAGAGFVLLAGAMRHQPKATEGHKQAEQKPVAVTVAPVTFRPIQQTVETVGTLNGYEAVSLAAEVDGRVMQIHHDVADRVKPGEPLLVINPADYKLSLQRAEKALQAELSRLGMKTLDPNYDVERVPAVQQARARMENAAIQRQRMETLAVRNAVSQEQLDTAKAEYSVTTAEYNNQVLLAKRALIGLQDLQLAISMAQKKLNDTVVRAPVPSQAVPGVGDELAYAITARKVAEGSYVREASEVFKLVIDRPLRLLVPVPERHAEAVKQGQRVSVATAASTRQIDGTVARINPAVDPATRTFEVEVLVPNREGTLKPGAFAKASIFTREIPRVATVPLESLVSFVGRTKIFLVEDGRAREVVITPGLQTADWVEVASPELRDGAMVVLSGQSAVLDGGLVAINSAGSSDSPRALAEAKKESRR
jgi:RND family efflux transporter MFP subunit